MIKTNYLASVCFLFLLIAMGCGTSDSISNSAGPSTTKAILNLEANPPSVAVGGGVIITVTLTNSETGVPISGGLIVMVSSSDATGDSTGTTGSSGIILWEITGISAPSTHTFCHENICASIRINTFPAKT